MKAISTKTDSGINIHISSKFLSLLEELVEKEYKESWDEEVNLYYDDYILRSITITPRGINVKYIKEGADTIYGHFKFKEIQE
jgi:hypothetical protein